MILWGMRINNLLKFARYEIQYWTTIPLAPLYSSRKYYFETLRFVIKFPNKNHFLFFCYTMFLGYFYFILSYKCKRKFFNWIPLPVPYPFQFKPFLANVPILYPVFIPFYVSYLHIYMEKNKNSQPVFTSSKSTMKTPKQFIKIESVQIE